MRTRPVQYGEYIPPSDKQPRERCSSRQRFLQTCSKAAATTSRIVRHPNRLRLPRSQTRSTSHQKDLSQHRLQHPLRRQPEVPCNISLKINCLQHDRTPRARPLAPHTLPPPHGSTINLLWLQACHRIFPHPPAKAHIRALHNENQTSTHQTHHIRLSPLHATILHCSPKQLCRLEPSPEKPNLLLLRRTSTLVQIRLPIPPPCVRPTPCERKLSPPQSSEQHASESRCHVN